MTKSNKEKKTSKNTVPTTRIWDDSPTGARNAEAIIHISRVIVYSHLVLLFALAGCEPSKVGQETEATRKSASYATAIAKISEEATDPLQIQGELSDTFLPYSDYTDLQRDKMTERVIGRIVQWTFPVYEISLSDGIYTIRAQSTQRLLTIHAYVKASGPEDDALLESLKTNDFITLKGRISGISLRTVIVLNPAIVIHNKKQPPDVPVPQASEPKPPENDTAPVVQIETIKDQSPPKSEESVKPGNETSIVGVDPTSREPAETRDSNSSK